LATSASTAATVADTAATVTKTSKLAGMVSWLKAGASSVGKFATSLVGSGSRLALMTGGLKTAALATGKLASGLVGSVASSAAAGTALVALGWAAASAATAYAGWHIGKWIGEFTGLHKSVAQLADEHRKALKDSPEIKKNMSEIEALADKRIKKLDAEGKARAKNLQLWGATHTQASIGAKDTASELKMLESMAKSGNKNADMLARLNKLKKESGQIPSQELQAQGVVNKQSVDGQNTLAKNMENTETKNKIDGIPGIKTNGPMIQNSVGQMNENTKENNIRLGEVVNLLSKIANDKKVSELLERYLPSIAENNGEGSLANVANGWI
jgi:hypothetical protein